MLKKYYRYIPALIIATVLAYQLANTIASNWFELLYFYSSGDFSHVELRKEVEKSSEKVKSLA